MLAEGEREREEEREEEGEERGQEGEEKPGRLTRSLLLLQPNKMNLLL